MARKKEDKTKSEDLASVLAESLNSAYKDEGKVAFFLNEGDDPSLISDWIPKVVVYLTWQFQIVRMVEFLWGELLK